MAWRLVSCGFAELDTTERLSLHFTSAVQKQGKLAKRGSGEATIFCSVPGSLTASGTRH